MRVFITGATGFLGNRLCRDLLRRGDQVVALTRDRRRFQGAADGPYTPEERFQIVEGDPATPGPWQERLGGCDAVVALAGEPVLGARWTDAQKARLERSRVDGMTRLHEAIAALGPERRPKLVLTGSAVGYYGDRGAEPCTEESPPGPAEDFLAQLCVRWEEESRKLADLGPRVTQLRIGIVLGPRGGALEKMLPAFRLFVGGPIGSGHQYIPWIHLDDVMGIIQLCLDKEDERLRGPVNLTAPEPATMQEFARTLGTVLHRPTVFRVPAMILRLSLGEAAEALLGGQRVEPRRVLLAGYRFRYPRLEEALRAAVAASS